MNETKDILRLIDELIASITAERDALRQALEPFALYAEFAYREPKDEEIALTATIDGDSARVTVGDFWNAQRILTQKAVAT